MKSSDVKWSLVTSNEVKWQNMTSRDVTRYPLMFNEVWRRHIFQCCFPPPGQSLLDSIDILIPTISLPFHKQRCEISFGFFLDIFLECFRLVDSGEICLFRRRRQHSGLFVGRPRIIHSQHIVPVDEFRLENLTLRVFQDSERRKWKYKAGM